jgi:hypothetical protein
MDGFDSLKWAEHCGLWSFAKGARGTVTVRFIGCGTASGIVLESLVVIISQERSMIWSLIQRSSAAKNII